MLLDHLRYVKGDISIKEVSDATMIKSSVRVYVRQARQGGGENKPASSFTRA